MAKPGPAPKTRKEKQLAGNPGKRPIKKEAFTPPTGEPPKPEFATDDAAAIWDDAVLRLSSQGILSIIDGAMLEVYCNNLARIRRLEKYLSENSETYECKTQTGTMWRPRAEVQTLLRCQVAHKMYSSEFGLSPSSRTRLSDPNQPDLFDGKNQWSKLN